MAGHLLDVEAARGGGGGTWREGEKRHVVLRTLYTTRHCALIPRYPIAKKTHTTNPLE